MLVLKKNEKLREVAVIWYSSYTLIALKFVDCWPNNYFPWRFRGKKLFFIHWSRYSTRSQWSSSLRMSRMNPRWFFTSFAKKENSRIRNIYFGRVWQDIRHSWPKKSSFLRQFQMKSEEFWEGSRTCLLLIGCSRVHSHIRRKVERQTFIILLKLTDYDKVIQCLWENKRSFYPFYKRILCGLTKMICHLWWFPDERKGTGVSPRVPKNTWFTRLP